ARLDVARTIANHEATRQVEPIFTGRREQELRFRLAAVAVVLRMMRADVVAIEVHARAAKVVVEIRVDGLHGFTGEVAATDAGLIGDNKQSIARILQLLSALAAPGISTTRPKSPTQL